MILVAHGVAEERADARVDLARKAPPAVEPRHHDAALERSLQLDLEHTERGTAVDEDRCAAAEDTVYALLEPRGNVRVACV